MRESVDANLRLTGTTETPTSAAPSTSPICPSRPASTSPALSASSPACVSALLARIRAEHRAQSRRALHQQRQSRQPHPEREGSANLQVRGTAADPVILGRVNPQQRRHHPQWRTLRAQRRHDPVRESVRNPARRQRLPQHHHPAIQHLPPLQRPGQISCRPNTAPTPRSLRRHHQSPRFRKDHRGQRPGLHTRPTRPQNPSSPPRSAVRSPAASPRSPASRNSPSTPSSPEAAIRDLRAQISPSSSA